MKRIVFGLVLVMGTHVIGSLALKCIECDTDRIKACHSYPNMFLPTECRENEVCQKEYTSQTYRNYSRVVRSCASSCHDKSVEMGELGEYHMKCCDTDKCNRVNKSTSQSLVLLVSSLFVAVCYRLLMRAAGCLHTNGDF